MMQVEKSHVPYPDEPPVHFPPATVWKQLSDYRKARYDGSGLGPDTPACAGTPRLLRSMRAASPLSHPPIGRRCFGLPKPP